MMVLRRYSRQYRIQIALRLFLPALMVFGIFVIQLHSGMTAAKPVEKTNVTTRKTADSYADKFAVVIGVDSFSDSSLNTALEIVESASKVKEALRASNFDADHVRLLLNNQATGQSIVSTIGDGWLAKLCGKGDLALIFVAMQCFPADDGKVYLLPYDTDVSNFYATAIDAEALMQLLREKVKARHVIVVFDTAFTGAPEMKAGCKAKFGRYNLSVERLGLPGNFAVLTSSKANQSTWGTYFSDNLARELNRQSREGLGSIFANVRRATMDDTMKDCGGCKLQAPAIYCKPGLHEVVLGDPPQKPRTTHIKEIDDYLECQNIYASLQSVLDHCQASKGQSGTKDGGKNDAAEITSSLPTIASAIAKLPEFAPLHYLNARLMDCHGDSKEALKEYDKAAHLDSANSFLRGQLAAALERNNHPSYDEWREAYRLNNKNLDALDYLASKSVEDGNMEKAIDYLQQSVKLYPGDAGLHLRLSDALKRKGQLKQAMAHAEEAVLIDNHSFDALVNLGAILRANKDDKGAHDAFRQALEIGSTDSEDYYFLARELEKTNDPTSAVRALEHFIEATSKNDNRLTEARTRLDSLKKKSAP